MSLKVIAFLFVVISMVSGSASVSVATTHPWFQPLLSMPKVDQVRAECVMQEESKSTEAHPNLGDDNGNPGQSGIFQMSNQPNGVWDLYVKPVLHVVIWKATPYQQAEGFVLVWRKDGFEPWHKYDGC